MFSQQKNGGATQSYRSIRASCEERFIRLEVLNRALATLVPDLARDSSLSRVLELLPDATQELQHDFLLLPELIVWMHGLRHQIETWLPLPSRRLSLSHHLDHLRTLALPVLMTAQPKTVIAIKVPATGVLVLPIPGVSIVFPALMAGAMVDAEGGDQSVWFKQIDCSVAWKEPISNCEKRTTKDEVVYHAKLTGQVTLRASCHWDRMPGNHPLIHTGSRIVEPSALPKELIDVWNKVRQDALDAGITDQVLAKSIRVLIVDPLEVGHSEGMARIHLDITREEVHHELRRALSETFCLLDQGNTAPTQELPLIELTYFKQIETTLMNGEQAVQELLVDSNADPFRLGCTLLYLENYGGAAEAFHTASRQDCQPDRAWQLYCLCLRHQGQVESFEHAIFTGRSATLNESN